MKRPLYLIPFLLTRLAVAQTGCHVDNLTGKWGEVTSMIGQNTNVDSLKELANNSKPTFVSWDFKEDGTFAFRSILDKKFKSYQAFTYDKGKCEIILGTKKDARENANLEILYLDNQYLIYWTDNNPKTYYTHLAVKLTQ
jgi:hypothetical protein